MKRKVLKFEEQEIEKILNEIRGKIVRAFNPVKIILFGSYFQYLKDFVWDFGFGI